ncbi:MAG: hypothetical protein N4A40_03005 [Tissierellales bacterium]|jgi:hypothetical protein|nr:hypothetical protein [Tissierellales bacterium]
MGNNASASSFGWDFQTNAAIILAIQNIEELVEIKVEGDLEDIEIKLSDGNYIYSQAKSVVEFEDYSNVLKKLKKALTTLNNAASCENSNELVYITNTPNPFNDKTSMTAFYGFTNKYYDEIPKVCKKKIDDYLDQLEELHIERENLKITVLPFHTNRPNERYKVINEQVTKFLSGLNNVLIGKADKVLDVWQSKMFFNSTVKQEKVNISKEELIWPIIVVHSELHESDEELVCLDEGEIAEVIRYYKDLISYTSSKIEFTSKVITDFQMQKSSLGTDKINKYIDLNWMKYQDNFNDGVIDGEILELLTRIILKKILIKRYLIDSIKKKVKL